MAITKTDLTSGSEATAGSSSTTASISPTGDSLVILSVGEIDTGSGVVDAPTASGGGMTTWTQVETLTVDDGTNTYRLTVFRAQQASPGSGAITISGDADVDDRGWSVSEFAGVTEDNAGNGAGAIVQSDQSSATSGSNHILTMSALGAAENRLYGATNGRGQFAFASFGGTPWGTVIHTVTVTAANAEVETAWDDNDSGDITIEVDTGFGSLFSSLLIGLEMENDAGGAATAVKDIIGTGIVPWAR